MQCEKFEECGRDVFYAPTRLCLAHEKERRATETKKATTKTAKRAAVKKAAGRRRTTEAVTATPSPATETRDES